MDQKTVTDNVSANLTHQTQESFSNHSNPLWRTSLSLLPEEHNDGSHEVETLHSHDDSEGFLSEDDHFACSNGLSDFSSDISLPEICIASNTKQFEEERNYEVQQAYRIFSEFLTEKHKGLTSPFLHPIENQDTHYGIGVVHCRSHAKQSICLKRMEEKFINKAYVTITEFVADFRLMLENCYRYHGVDHWLSKQAQKLEIMLEQKLTLLSRKLREKTTLAVTSKGRFAVGEEWTATSSTRRRQASRGLKSLTVGGHESIMVQSLRVEEHQKAKEAKRQRELEKKEAEEISAKETDEWEKNLLSQASPHNVDTLWELPAIGHFLCLAQTALNLPEIVFFELERCLLMPRCNILLSKIMSSLLSPPHRRLTLHRRPVMSYRRWESELRQRVKAWYQSVGASHDQAAQAEQIGLCHQFFRVLGETSPLEAKAFHTLPFYQRLWLLKGLCDHVYETQKDVQNAVLAQPIHECRESILGYDSKENAYIHFPHFCGADLRIYCRSPCTPPTVPSAAILVKKVEILHKLEGDFINDTSEVSGTSFNEISLKTEMCTKSKIENSSGEKIGRWHSSKTVPLKSNDEADRDRSQAEPQLNIAQITRKRIFITKMEERSTEQQSKKLKEENETNSSLCSKNEPLVQEHCLSIGEHCYTGRSPARSTTVPATPKNCITKRTAQDDQKNGCCEVKISNVKSKQYQCCCGCFESSTQSPSEHTQTSCVERESVKVKVVTTKKEQRKKKERKILSWIKRRHKRLRRRPYQSETSKLSMPNRSTACKAKDEKTKNAEGKARSHLTKKKTVALEPPFKLVCTNLDDLRDLINKTEDELDDLECAKKRLKQWYNKREAVKDLHSTLTRLLNELTPWEPKLIKAYQRNRLRLKKEFEIFNNHPEYRNFLHEECISSSDGNLGLLLEELRHTKHDDIEHILPQKLGGNVTEFTTERAMNRPETHISYNHHEQPQSTSGDNLNQSDTLNMRFTGRKLKNRTLIPILLAKNVGNKVTLMKKPAYPLKIENANLESKKIGIGFENADVCSFDCPQNSVQAFKQKSEQSPKQPVTDTVTLPFSVISKSKSAESPKESVHMSQSPSSSSNTNQRCEKTKSKQVIILPSNIILHKSESDGTSTVQQSKEMDTTNFSGIHNPENKTRVQQVPPKDIDLTDTTLLSTDISVFSKAQCSNYVPRLNCGVPTHTSQCLPKKSPISSISSSLLMSTDSKQELKTVCIRESQSILVTTRGGNTGIVKIQKSSDQPSSLAKVPIITISPQFRACLVPQIAPLFYSHSAGQSVAAVSVTTGPAQPQNHIQSLNSNTKVTACDKTTSILFSQDMNHMAGPTKCPVTGLRGYTANVSKPATTEALLKTSDLVNKTNPSITNFVTAPILSAVDFVHKPRPDKPNEDDEPQSKKIILISPSSNDGNVCRTKLLPTSLALTNPLTTKTSLPFQDSRVTLLPATITGPIQQVMKPIMSQKMVSHTLSSINPVSLCAGEAAVSSGKSTNPSVQIPCVSATTITQNIKAQSSKCKDAEQVKSITAQPAFSNSDVISRGIVVPSSSLNSLKHLGLSSISNISKPVNITYPCTNSLPASHFVKPHGLSTIIISSNSKIDPALSQSISKPILIPSTQNGHLITHSSGSFDKTSQSCPFTNPHVSFAVPKSSVITEGYKGLSTTSCTKAITGADTVQQQIVISTSTPLQGGAQVVLNNARFTVPPKGFGPGNHVYVISGSAPQNWPTTSAKEATVPFQKMNHAPGVLKSETNPLCVSAAACSPDIKPSLHTTSSFTAVTLSIPDNTSLNETKITEKSPNTENTAEGTSDFTTIGSTMTQTSTVWTSPTTTSVAHSLSPPPSSVSHRPSAALIPSFKADSIPVTVTSCSQVSHSPPTQASAQVPSQNPAISTASISATSSSPTTLMHMGHGGLLV